MSDERKLNVIVLTSILMGVTVVVLAERSHQHLPESPYPVTRTDDRVDIVPNLVRSLAPVVRRPHRSTQEPVYVPDQWIPWTPSHHSPFLMLSADEVDAYIPTLENLKAWVASVDELADIDVDAIVWNDDVRHLWGLCREQQALYSFVVKYSDRERARWLAREPSVGLEFKLQPVKPFMDKYVGDGDGEVWRLLGRFSDEVAERIRGEGEDADDGADEDSRWELFGALSKAGAPSFEAVVEILRQQQQ